jgi:hypothetical protein
MRLDRHFLLSLVALSSSSFNVDAFIARQHGKASGLTAFGTNTNVRLLQQATHSFKTHLYAADDDDDDDDDDDYDEDEDEGPLAKGVDSVSWLPSVAGSKGADISSVKEVSGFERF